MQPKTQVEQQQDQPTADKTNDPSKSQTLAQSLAQSKMQATLNANPIIGGLSGLGGNFMSLALKEAKDELRVSKKAEQLTKEKLSESQKRLDQAEDQFQKYKQDAEMRLDTLRTENSLLQMRLQHMHEQNEALERSSSQSQQNSTGQQELLKIVEEYSRTNDLKQKEIDDLLARAVQNKAKTMLLKRDLREQESKYTRVQSKLDNMTKFCRIFIKSIKTQNQALQETVRIQQQECTHLFTVNAKSLHQEVLSKFQQLQKHYEQLLAGERQHVSKLAVMSQQSAEKGELEKELERVMLKVAKYKAKLRESPQAASLQKLELQSQEKDNLILALKEQIQRQSQRESDLLKKLESTDTQSRHEYQRLVELHEGSSRYRDIRDLYEEKLQKHETQLMECKEALIKAEVRLEFMGQDLSKMRLVESRLESQLVSQSQEYKEKISQIKLELQYKEQQIIDQESKSKELLQELKGKTQKIESFSEEKLQMSSAARLMEMQHSQLQTKYSQDMAMMATKAQEERAVLERQAQAMREGFKIKLSEKDSFYLQEISQLQAKVQNSETQHNELTTQHSLQLQRINEEYQNKVKDQNLASQQLQNQNQALSLQINELNQAHLALQLMNDCKIGEIVELRAQLLEGDSSRSGAARLEQLERENQEMRALLELRSQSVQLGKIKQLTTQNEESQTSRFDTCDASIQSEALPEVIINNMDDEPHPPQILPKPQALQKRPLKPQTQPRPQIAPSLTKTVQKQPINDQVQQQELQQVIEAQPIFTVAAPVNIKQEEPKVIKPVALPVEESKEPVKQPIKAQPAQPVQQQPQQAGGIYGIFSSFMSLLSAKKQGFTGKPASAMYYCDKKKRWIIDGEDDSGDDVPPPPPPKAKIAEENSQPTIVQQPLQKTEEQVGPSSLPNGGFSGALANRNRSKSQKPAQNNKAALSFPQPVITAPQVKVESPKVKAQEMVFEESFNTTQKLDQADLNATTNTANDQLSTTQIISQLQVTEDQEHLLRAREAEWKQKYSQQNERIQGLKEKVNHLQEALKQEKAQTQQTIHELEQFSQEMQKASTQNQEELSLLQTQISRASEEQRLCELWRWQAEESLRAAESELGQVRAECRTYKQQLFSVELDARIRETNHQMQLDDLQLALSGAQAKLQNQDPQLEDQNETLKWQLAAETQALLTLRHDYDMLISESQLLRQRLDQSRFDQQRVLRDAQDRADRDKEAQLRDVLQKASQERDQLKDQFKKQLQELQSHIKKLQDEKLTKTQEQQRLLQQKDHYYQQQLKEQDQIKQKEISDIQAKLESQSSQASLKLQAEKSQIKKQLHGLESILNKRDQELTSAVKLNEETQQELDQLASMRAKLNDHIVYLQNEIRKRDELLEGDSDFESGAEDYLDNDSASNLSQDQSLNRSQRQVQRWPPLKRQQVSSKLLDEARQQIRSLVDEKIQLRKQLSSLTQQLNTIQGGLDQIQSLFPTTTTTTQQQHEADIQSNSQIDQIIQRFFDLLNSHDASVIELKHQNELLAMQADQQHNLRFDIELLTQERDLLCQDLQEAHQEIDDVRRELAETAAKLNESQQDYFHKLQHQQQQSTLKLAKTKADSDALQQEHEIALQTLRGKLAQKDDQIQQITGRKRHMQIDLDHNLAQIKDLTQKLSQMNMKFAETCAQNEAMVSEFTEEKEKVKLELFEAQRKESELVHQLSKAQQLAKLTEQQLKTTQEQLQSLTSDFDNIAQSFLLKKQHYKQQILTLKQQSLQNSTNDHLSQQIQEAEQVISEIKQQAEQVVTQVKGKFEAKEGKYKSRILHLESVVSQLTDQITSLQQSASDYQHQRGDSERESQEAAQIKKLSEALLVQSTQHSQLLFGFWQVSRHLTRTYTRQVDLSSLFKWSIIKPRYLTHQLQLLPCLNFQDWLTLQKVIHLRNLLSALQFPVQTATHNDSAQTQEREMGEQHQRDVQQLSLIIQQHKEQYAELHEQLANQREHYDLKLQASKQKQEELISEFKQMLESSEQTITHQQQQLQEFKLNYAHLQHQLQEQLQAQAQQQQQQDLQTETFTQKQGEYKHKCANLKKQLRELLGEYERLEQQRVEEKARLEQQVQVLQQEKLDLSQSLDFTRIQQQEKNDLTFMQEANNQVLTLKDLLAQYDAQADSVADFANCIALLTDLLRNAHENQHQVTQLVQERDELQNDYDGVCYKLRLIAQERDTLQKQVKLMPNMVDRKGGKWEEDRNDFIIKFDSMSKELNNKSQEVLILKEKLEKFEKSKQGETPAAQRSFFSSLFLTQSDLK